MLPTLKCSICAVCEQKTSVYAIPFKEEHAYLCFDCMPKVITGLIRGDVFDEIINKLREQK